MTLKELYNYGKQNLQEPAESLIFCEEFYNKSRKDIIMTPDLVIENTQIFIDAVQQRQQAVPLQYILGYWEFCGLKLKVLPEVLIPREDTLVLVDCATAFIKDKLSIGVDLCSGTGAVALAVAKCCKNVQIDALELYPVPCECLQSNIQNFGTNKVHFKKADIFTAYNNYSNLDFIVSNPPYIASEQIQQLQKEVQNEPHTALDGGEDGLDFYRVICEKWSVCLKQNGFLAVEIGEEQEKSVSKLFAQNGFYDIKVLKDFNSLPRVVCGFKN